MERLFARMEDRYGKQWADSYGGFPRERVKRTWAADLADLSADELKIGLAACRDKIWPPTLPEFRALCCPTADAQRAWYEAQTQMPRRAQGFDQWSSPVVFWAAARMGQDLAGMNWPRDRARWENALDVARGDLRHGRLPPDIPPRRSALPAPAETWVAPQAARLNLEKIRAMLGIARKSAPPTDSATP